MSLREASPGLVEWPQGGHAGLYSVSEVENMPIIPAELGGKLPPPPPFHTDSDGYGMPGEMPPGALHDLPDVHRRHWAEGVAQRHEEQWYKSKTLVFSIPATAPAGTVLQEILASSSTGGVTGPTRRQMGMRARGLLCYNPSAYTLQERATLQLIPAGAYGFPMPLYDGAEAVEFLVFAGTAATVKQLIIIATEQLFEPAALSATAI